MPSCALDDGTAEPVPATNNGAAPAPCALNVTVFKNEAPGIG